MLFELVCMYVCMYVCVCVYTHVVYGVFDLVLPLRIIIITCKLTSLILCKCIVSYECYQGMLLASHLFNFVNRQNFVWNTLMLDIVFYVLIVVWFLECDEIHVVYCIHWTNLNVFLKVLQVSIKVCLHSFLI